MAIWRPRDSDPEMFDTLNDGIPEWMRRPFYMWLEVEFNKSSGELWQRSVARMEQFDILSRNQRPFAASLNDHSMGFLNINLEDEDLIDIADFAVATNAADGGLGVLRNHRLEELLRDAGSVWKVGTRGGFAALERRMPEGVQQAAEAVLATPGHAGILLSEAWHAAFGRQPDYEKAYSKSVKAVEAASIPVLQPNHGGATLGTVVGQMRSDGNWSLEMTREHADHSSANVILGMAQTLWTGQNDRHAGQAGYTASTQAEAEAAVFLAVPLVQFFSSGAVAKR